MSRLASGGGRLLRSAWRGDDGDGFCAADLSAVEGLVVHVVEQQTHARQHVGSTGLSGSSAVWSMWTVTVWVQWEVSAAKQERRLDSAITERVS